MTKKLFPAVVFILSLQPFSAQAASAETASVGVGPAKLCEQQQRQIKDLENDRERMAQEIYYLEDKVRSLNETLDNIRSQVGNSEPRPTSYGQSSME
jgi:peptidoglycan hydrolase CwlO-like protein